MKLYFILAKRTCHYYLHGHTLTVNQTKPTLQIKNTMKPREWKNEWVNNVKEKNEMKKKAAKDISEYPFIIGCTNNMIGTQNNNRYRHMD